MYPILILLANKMACDTEIELFTYPVYSKRCSKQSARSNLTWFTCNFLHPIVYNML